MKRILIILFLFAGFQSCQNFDIEHPDYKYTSGFFPYQYPVRTLVLGDYIYDNANDNAHKFVISVAMGGVYENSKERVFDFEVDETLCKNVLFTDGGDQVKAMPKNYYTLSSANKIIIPKDKFNGGIEVQLSDAFFADPLAIKNTYVVPLRLKGSYDVDTILSGRPIGQNADPRINADWFTTPKNFTMFAVKYINEYHGNYFHYGSSTVKDATGAVTETTTYSTPYVENNAVTKLSTTGRFQVSFSTLFKSVKVTGPLELLLTFNGNNCSISAPPGSNYTVTGNGSFKTKEYEWGNKKRDGIVLDYTVTTNTGMKYEAKETLVARDRAVIMEVYSPVVK